MSNLTSKTVILPPENSRLIPKQIWRVFEIFTQNGYEIYLVGAGVRRIIDQKLPINCDFTTNATPEIIQALFEDSFYDNQFGTVGIPIKTDLQEEVYEITPYRTEWGYSDKRRPDRIIWGDKLEEDLKRRDFTFNAIVIGPAFAKASTSGRSFDPSRDKSAGKASKKWDGKTLVLVDLFGGQKDFGDKIVCAVGDPKERFYEDALRMMRAIRFASQLGFIIEEKTLAAIKENANWIRAISAERVCDELFKILGSDYPDQGYQLLRNTGLAGIILPEMEATFGVEQKSPGRHHFYDVGTHSLKSLKFCPSKDPLVRLATFIHDVGKTATRKVEKDGTVTFYNHELVSTSTAYRVAKRLRLSKDQIKKLTTLVRWHQFSVDERQTDKAIRRFIRHVGKENLEDILDLRIGDRLGGGAAETSWRLEKFKQRLVEVQKQPFSISDLKVNGHDVMETLDISPGPLVGQILEKLFSEVEEGNLKNEREILLKKIKPLGQELVSEKK